MADISDNLALLVAAFSLVLLAISAFVSGSEIAFFSLDPAEQRRAVRSR